MDDNRILVWAFVVWYSQLSFSQGKDCGTLCRCVFEPRNTKVTCKGPRTTSVPKGLPANTTEIYLSGTSIVTLHAGELQRYAALRQIYFLDLPKISCHLQHLEPGAFDRLHSLELISLIGCEKLQEIKKGVFAEFLKLRNLRIYRSGLRTIPDLSLFRTTLTQTNGLMDEFDLSFNRIEYVGEHNFLGIKTHILKLNNNRLQKIETNSFYTAQIVKLHLYNNPTLTDLQEGAFTGIKDLMKLDLSRTSITNLPTTGLQDIQELYLRDTKSLRHFPSIYKFEKITKAELYYPHHCCAFSNPEKQNSASQRAYEEVQKRIHQECSTRPPGSTPATNFDFHVNGFQDFIPQTTPVPTNAEEPMRKKRFTSGEEERQEFENSLVIPMNGSNSELFAHVFIPHKSSNGQSNSLLPASELFSNWHIATVPDNVSGVHHKALCGKIVQKKNYRSVDCHPRPDAFNPCEDVMGYEWLRIVVWIVLMAAILGNTLVFVVYVSGHRKMTVTKFLMCNLAFADFLMGIYLLLLASIDIHTLGQYFNYAILWQNEGGCQAAGFLTVFSCELSIFTLTVITFERWYAISYAIHLTKRLRLRQAMTIMVCGWIYALLMACLPLLGISGYGNVSICLPMKVDNIVDQVYVISLLVINGVAFVCICVCYTNMYHQVRQSDSTARSNDATIAKRMAMLVFTNFVCWAPIAFFGLTASSGWPLIDITHSKILLVFFYPLNSCANPFLYVIITKQFRKDTVAFLGRYGFCTRPTGKSKVTGDSKSLTHSRKDSLAVHHHLIHPVSTSVSRFSYKSSSSKRHSFSCTRMRGSSVPCEMIELPLAALKRQVSAPVGPEEEKSALERKLSVVRECHPALAPNLTNMQYADDTDVQTNTYHCDSESGNDYHPMKGSPRHHKWRPSYSQQYSSDTYVSSQSGTTTTTDQTSGAESFATDVTWHAEETSGNESTSHPVDERGFCPISEEAEEVSQMGSMSGSRHLDTDDECDGDNEDSGNVDDEDNNDDDCVQQTLLKHSTLRDSPVAQISDRIFIETQFVTFERLDGCDMTGV